MMAKKYQGTDLEKFLSCVVVDETTRCWVWQKGKRNGYGFLYIGSRTSGARKQTIASRFSYESYVGPIPNGMHVLHSCDQPSCCNPLHLFLGTDADNTADRVRKRRPTHPKRELPYGVYEEKTRSLAKPFQAQIRYRNKTICLGRYATANEASMAVEKKWAEIYAGIDFTVLGVGELREV